MDMLREVASAARTNTILLPHSPDAVGQLQALLRDGLMIGNLTSDAATTDGGASNQQLPREG
jgi:hypothetical protein